MRILRLALSSIAALFAGALQLMIARGWIDRDFIATRTTGFDAVEEYCAQ